MLKLLFKLIVLISFFCVSLNAVKISSNVDNDIERFTINSAGSIYNLNETALKNDIKVLFQNNCIKALDIKDALTGEIFVKAYRDDGNIIMNRAFPFKTDTLHSITKDVKHNGDIIGTVIIYCEKATLASLTKEEKEWLNKQKDITIGIQTKWIPLSYVENNTPKGLSVDFINLINNKLGGMLTIVPDNFKNSLDKLKDKQIDAMVDITPTKERKKFYLFTTPYMTIPHAILTSKDNPKKYKGEMELNNVTMSVEKGFRTPLSVKESAPNAKFKVYENSFEAIEALSMGQVDAYVGNRAVANYVLEKSFITNLEFTTNVKRKGSVLAIGVNKENKILRSILQKALDSITEEQHKLIVQKYIMPKEVKVNGTKRLAFTQQEKKWLQDNPLIKLAYMKDWPTDDEGNNIHTELIKLLNEYSGLNFTFAKFDTWKEGFAEAKIGKNIYGIMSLSWTKDREDKFFYYSKPYNFIPANIIVRKENNTIKSLEDLIGKKVYLKEKAATNNIVKDASQEIGIVNLPSEELMLAKLSSSDEAQAVLTHNVKQELLDKYNLKVAKSFYTKYSELSIGVAHKHKPLRSIIDKIQAVIPSSKLTDLRNKVYTKTKHKNINFLGKLTAKEKAWLLENSLIKIAFMNYWTTDDYGNNIHSDIIKLLNRYSGLNIVPAKYDAWKDGFNEAIKGNNIHGIMNLSWSKERAQKYFHYTKAYNFIPNFLVVRKDNNTIKSLDDLKDKTVYIKEKEISHKTIEDLPFEVNVIDAKNDKEMIKNLSTLDEADAYLSYTADKIELEANNLKVVKILYDKYGEVAIGVSKKHKTLQSILNKLYEAIPSDEFAKLRNKSYEKTKKITFIDSLSAKEKAWIKEHKVIKIGVDAGFAPYAFVDENGMFRGVAADFANIISKMLNIKMEMVPGLSWPQIIQASKDKTIDLITTASYRPEREEFLNFTQGYIPTPLVIMTKSDNNKIQKRDDIKGKKIALVKKYSSSKSVLKEFKDQFEPYFVDTPLDGLKAVSIGEADAYIGVLGINVHQSMQAGISNLKVAAPYNLETNYQNYGVRKDWPILAEILDKALDAISEEEKIQIFQKWVPVSGSAQEKKIDLTPEEKNWLTKQDNRIKMCIDPNWMPIEKINEKGNHTGITKDIYDLFEKRLGVKFELVPTNTWVQSVEFAQERRCDILSFLQENDERKKFLNFTSTMYQTPDIIVAKKDTPFLPGLEELNGKKVGVVKGYAIEEKIKKGYPEIELVYIKNQLDGFNKVSSGELDAIIDTLLISAYNINLYGYQDLKIAGKLDAKNEYKVGVRNDSSELLSIMEKAVNSLSDTDITKINSKWVAVEFEHKFDYSLLWKILLGVFIIFVIFVYWNRKLAVEVQKRKEAEEHANRANAAKSMFLARMSHEIRTPMNAILGMLYLTQKSNLNPIQENYVEKAKNSADSLLHVINDILDFSKIEAGKLDIESVEFDFNEMISKIASVMSFKAEEKGLELLINFDARIPQFLISDPVRLEQILFNLVSNAIKFTSSGEVVISPKLKKLHGNKLILEFCIQDSGIGISKENQDKLFKDFSQVDESTTRKFGGSGLGLVISKKLSQLLGGNIWLESSEENKGSTFCFQIECQQAAVEHSKPKVFPESLQDLKTLIVDDNHVACEILSKMLNSFNLLCESVYSGEEALELILKEKKSYDIVKEKKSYDIVFLDYKLGGIDGVETYKRIVATLGEKAPKIIMVTAYARDEVIETFKEAGIESFLTKPVHPSLLFDTILHVLNKEEYISKDKPKDIVNKEVSVAPIKGAYILLVEDNEVNQEFAIMLLEGNGLQVDVANDGLEALKKAQIKKYDMILMDIQMPNMDGLEATKEIRKLEDEYYKNVPIVALSAHAMSGDVGKSLDAGMNAHVTKPIDPNKLFSVMLQFIAPTKYQDTKEEPKEIQTSLFKEQKSDLIDYQGGIVRTGNNELGYMKILKSFALKYKEFDQEIENSLQNNDLIQAERNMHEIKGVSGNIGAIELFEISKEIDALLKTEQAPEKEQMESFKTALAKTIDEINLLKFDNGVESIEEFDLEKVMELLEIIENNLEVNIVESEDALSELTHYISNEADKLFVEKITMQLENFDTDAAKESIKEFKEMLKNKGKDNGEA